jgi:hypothetical protein
VLVCKLSSVVAPVVPRRYVHRVGRTARMGHAGEAVLFLLPSEAPGYLQLLGRHAVRLRALPLPPVLGSLDDPEGAMVRFCPASAPGKLTVARNAGWKCLLQLRLSSSTVPLLRC